MKMKCTQCENQLSTTLGSRPVSICKHSLCESCATGGRCPKCGVSTEESIEDCLNFDLLQVLTEMERLVSESQRLELFHCSKHVTKEIEYVCCAHEVMMCSSCAIQHLEHWDKVIPYFRDTFEKDTQKFTDFAQNIKNECCEIIDTFKVASCSADKNLYTVLSDGWKFVEKYGNKDTDYEITFPRVSGDVLFDSVILTEQEDQSKLRDFLGCKRDLTLLYRASRDGDTAAKFHALCDNKGPTVTLVSANGKKFGGFAEASWLSNNTYQYADNSFLFMIEPHVKLSCHQPTHAQHSSAGYGPIFGGGHGLLIHNSCMSNSSSNASNPGNSYGQGEEENTQLFKDLGNFQVNELEVFSAK